MQSIDTRRTVCSVCRILNLGAIFFILLARSGIACNEIEQQPSLHSSSEDGGELTDNAKSSVHYTDEALVIDSTTTLVGENTQIDLGLNRPGSKIVVAGELLNNSGVDLEIRSVEVECGCTSFDLPLSSSFSKNATKKFRMEISFPGKSGNFAKNVRIIASSREGNDDIEMVFALSVISKVRNHVEIHPSRLLVDLHDDSSPVRATKCVVQRFGGESISIQAIQHEIAGMKAVVQEVEPKQCDQEFIVSLDYAGVKLDFSGSDHKVAIDLGPEPASSVIVPLRFRSANPAVVAPAAIRLSKTTESNSPLNLRLVTSRQINKAVQILFMAEGGGDSSETQTPLSHVQNIAAAGDRVFVYGIDESELRRLSIGKKNPLLRFMIDGDAVIDCPIFFEE